MNQYIHYLLTIDFRKIIDYAIIKTDINYESKNHYTNEIEIILISSLFNDDAKYKLNRVSEHLNLTQKY